ncbi:hypothetical protein TNCV_1079111 [Trichonephila clavipes]|nr:hypothetical protein TNCV_1079111 [Trichonephila clavipes]
MAREASLLLLLYCTRNWNRLIPPSSILYCGWLGVATWYLMVGGVSEVGTNGVEDGWPGEPGQPMRWMKGVSMDSD